MSPPLLAPSSLHGSWPLVPATPLRYLSRSLPHHPCTTHRHRVCCGSFQNCDLTNSFSLITHRHQFSSTSSRNTPRITFQDLSNGGARNRLSLMGSSAGCTYPALVTPTGSPIAPAVHASVPLSWDFVVPGQSPPPYRLLSYLYTPTRCFRNRCFLHPCPSSWLLSYSFNYLFLW